MNQDIKMIVFHKGDGVKLNEAYVKHLPRKGDAYRANNAHYQVTEVIWDYGQMLGPVVVIEVDDLKD